MAPVDSEPRPRRFPLTRTALFASALSIPAYAAWLSLSGSRSGEATAVATQQAGPRPVVAPSPESRDVVRTSEAAHAPRSDGSGAEAWASVTETARSDAPAPEEAAPAPVTGAAPDDAAAPMSPPASAPVAKAARERRASPAEPPMVGAGPGRGAMAKGEAGGGGSYDAQIVPGTLTAGLIDDRRDTRLLDELRQSATLRDPQLAQAIGDHKARGAAPDDSPSPLLEVGFVIDTTGSMGDELQYLKTEIRSIAQEIAQQYPQVSQRYGLVTYRDHGDEYLVRRHPFEDVSGFVEHLGVESANGGGDFPEAMDVGLSAAAELDWTEGTAAKLVFLVADAPPHAERYAEFVSAASLLARREVSIYPVASSGVEPICEYLMRWSARTTGGQYLFLTDHSGVGAPHGTPHVDQYDLKSLRAHMLDMIRDELGTPVQGPATAQVSAPMPTPSVVVPASSWLERHGLFAMILGTIFLIGFAGDMALTAIRR